MVVVSSILYWDKNSNDKREDYEKVISFNVSVHDNDSTGNGTKVRLGGYGIYFEEYPGV